MHHNENRINFQRCQGNLALHSTHILHNTKIINSYITKTQILPHPHRNFPQITTQHKSTIHFRPNFRYRNARSQKSSFSRVKESLFRRSSWCPRKSKSNCSVKGTFIHKLCSERVFYTTTNSHIRYASFVSPIGRKSRFSNRRDQVCQPGGTLEKKVESKSFCMHCMRRAFTVMLLMRKWGGNWDVLFLFTFY